MAHPSGKATYIANEAIMVENGDLKVLFDPLPLTGFGTYPDVMKTDVAAILNGQSPFDDIDLVFISHAHRDHFSAKALNLFMSAQTDTHVVAPSQALDLMKGDASWDEAFETRMTVLDMQYGEAPMEIIHDDIKASAVRIPHAGWPIPQRAKVQNMVYRVDLGDGVIVMHMGDADVNPNHYAPFRDHWNARQTDTNFPPYWFLLSETGKKISTNTVNAKNAIGIHVPIKTPPELVGSGQDYFSVFGETRDLGQEHQHSPCEPVNFKDASYTVCTISDANNIRLFWGDDTGEPFGSFEAVKDSLKSDGMSLIMAMNAGMYHPDRSPVGLYRENGETFAPLQTKESYGNFGMLPNGVFFVHEGQAGVAETNSFLLKSVHPDYATQSGPMLVIEGNLHSKFKERSTSKRRRNGVGVSQDGATTYFVISEEPVNFFDFASLFKDHLKTPNALYLDGNISRLHDPLAGRSDPGLPMGPIVGLVTGSD